MRCLKFLFTYYFHDQKYSSTRWHRSSEGHLCSKAAVNLAFYIIETSTLRNSPANTILGRLHGVLVSIFCTASFKGKDGLSSSHIEQFIMDATWAVTASIILYWALSQKLLMQYDLLYLVDWNKIWLIWCKRQKLSDKTSKKENEKNNDFDYTIGDNVMIINKGICWKARNKHNLSFTLYKLIQMEPLGFNILI